MPIADNTRIKLDVYKSKKNYVAAAPGTIAGTDEVAIWAGSAINADLTQSIVGGFHQLHSYAQSHLKDLTGTPAILHLAFGAGDTGITVGAGGTGDLTLEIGAGVHGGDRSHYLDRTFKRLIEAWLEESK